MDNFAKTFKELCDSARHMASSGEQVHVVSTKESRENRRYDIVKMRELPSFLEIHMTERPFIMFSTRPEIY